MPISVPTPDELSAVSSAASSAQAAADTANAAIKALSDRVAKLESAGATTPPSGGGTTTPPSGGTLSLKAKPYQVGLVPNAVTFGVWYAPTQDGAQLKTAGVNLAFNAEHNAGNTSLQDNGILLALSPEWSDSEVSALGSKVVARMVGDDEIEMNTGFGKGPDRLVRLKQDVAGLRNQPLPVGGNFGKGVDGTYWPGDGADFHDFVSAVDFAIADNYTYTSSGVRGDVQNSPNWPGGSAMNSWSYYWQAQQMKENWGKSQKPVYVTVETAMPYLGDSDRRTITTTQIRGAVWAGIIGGASGIMFFQHNNDGKLPNYSLENATLGQAVGKITAEVQTLASVINSPSYDFTTGGGTSSMTKQAGGYVYLFVIPDLSGAATKTFSVPSGLKSTAEVVGESRSVNISSGKITDKFAAESDHHVYKIAIA